MQVPVVVTPSSQFERRRTDADTRGKGSLMRRTSALAICLILAGCGGESRPSTSPSPTPSPAPAPTPAPAPAPTPAPAPVTISLSGIVTAYGARVNSATVRFLDGPNAGQSTTTINGDYRFTSVTAGNANLAASAPGYTEARSGISLFASSTLNFSIITAQPFTRSGSGNDVFDVPSYVTRIRITGAYSGYSSNFIVRIGGSLVVNDLIGTGWSSTTSTGTYLLSPGGGTAQITNSQGVAWSFTEVR